MTSINLATLIQSCEVTLPVPKNEVPTYYRVELTSKQTDVFKAVYARLLRSPNLHAVPPIQSVSTHAEDEGCPLTSGGVAVFYFKEKSQSESIRETYSLIEKSVEKSVINNLSGEPEPLQTLMDIHELGGTYLAREEKTTNLDLDAAEKRAREIAGRSGDDADYDARIKQAEARLSNDSLTIKDEVEEMLKTITAVYSGVYGVDILRNEIERVVAATVCEYTEGLIIENHASLYTDIALEKIIATLGNADDARESLLAKAEKQQSRILNNHKRSNVIRRNWDTQKDLLAKALKAHLPGLKHKRESTPVSFGGVHIGSLLTQTFDERLSTKEFKFMKSMGVSDIELLAGAIVSQIGGFIELKRGNALRKMRHQQAKELVLDTGFSRCDAYVRMNDDLESLFSRDHLASL